MKKSFLASLLISFLFLSCDKDEPIIPAMTPVQNPDKASWVTITSPGTGSAMLILDWIYVNATVKNDQGIKNVSFYMISPDDRNKVIKLSDIQLPGDKKKEVFSHAFRLPKNSLTGDYTIYVKHNELKDSIKITMQTPDLNQEAFTSAFLSVNYFSLMDWYGYTSDDQNWLDGEGLYYWFALLVDRNWDQEISVAEWNSFTVDFNLKDQTLARWDGNADGNLGRAEFNSAIKNLAFINNWDIDEDGLIEADEMARVFFNSWDHNQDNLLSKEEYLDNFYTYCLLTD